ncbi:hypothetical protein TNCV_4105332 [Trichonephila clavipes]|nr:hypothetical protein TNCV_4105332 [Trichonephila clavipes]
MGKVLQTCQIIIWDECTMSHKKALEALDRTLRDFRGNRRIFGGALILLSGDFRQTLPIIPRSTPTDELHACLKSSVLWRHLQKLTLKTNMRVQLQRDASAGNFAKQLMDIGNGRMEIDESTQCITLPANFLAKNIDVNTINFTIQHGIPSETTTYKSIDTVENQDEVINYPTEFLNSLDLPGMPPHVLTLKIGVPIILLRNINPPRLCNGTRLSVKKMMNNVIEATILTGKFKGEDVLLPRIPMIPTDMPFEFKRLQFPYRFIKNPELQKTIIIKDLKMSLSKEELKPQVDKLIQRFLGLSEPSQSLISTAVRCLIKGYDQRKTVDKLSSYLDGSKAEKLTDQLFKNFISDNDTKRKSRKRHREDEISESKKSKAEEQPNLPVAGQPSPGQLTTMQIQEMMANAQRMIEERKKQMLMSGVLSQVPSVSSNLNSNTSATVPSTSNDASQSLSENKARIAQLTAMIQAKLSSKPTLLTNWKPDDSKQHKPAPLILDSEGRTLDMTGKEVHLTHHMPTLKANIRAQKRAQFKMSQEKVMEELYEQKFYDPRVSAKTFQRPRKSFKFHDRGKFEQLAQRLRTKAQLEKLQEEIAQAAKKTGISSATKLALIVPRKEYKEGEVPEVEWWDSYILQSDNYDKYNEESKLEGVTALVEHPIQMKSPCDASQPVFIPLYLTKKERKKLRRQNRREAWKEKQEKIRLGLEPPPEPKVRMSNLMRVLGNQAVQDPTKVEAHVREQMAKRQKAHEEANAARKLTAEQKREKKIRKLKEDTSTGVNVAVYR